MISDFYLKYKMESLIRFLSLNVGMKNNLAGLDALIKEHKFDVILLHEIRLSREGLDAKFSHLEYTSAVNIEEEDPSKPGTAVLWKSSLPVSNVIVLVKCRAQLVLLGNYALLNIYAPSGSDKRNERAIFFSKEVFQGYTLHSQYIWIMGGDFNCLLNKLDVEDGIGFSQKRCTQLLDLEILSMQ